MLAATAGIFRPLAAIALLRADNHTLWLAMAAWMLGRTTLLWWIVHRRAHPEPTRAIDTDEA